jgi:addiction module HigA family antidote
MMKNPPHLGLGLKDEIEELELSVAEAAKALGVTRQQLYRLINGDCGITPEMAVRLELAIGSNADFWLRLQANYDLAQIRNRATPLNIKRLPRREVA